MTENYHELMRQLEERKSKVERDIARMRSELLDDVTMQSILAVLLRRMKEKGILKRSDLGEIATASKQLKAGNYSPGALIQRILAETDMDREMKRKRPD